MTSLTEFFNKHQHHTIWIKVENFFSSDIMWHNSHVTITF